MTHLLIDADVDAFAGAIMAEQEFNWGDDNYSIVSDLSDAKKTFYRRIQNYKKLLGATDITLCFSSSDNFRKDFLADYKANRTAALGARKPLGYRDLIEWAKTEFPSKTMPRLEADDVMGILSTREPGKYTIVTVDKDLKTIPGRLFRYPPQKPSDGVVEILDQKAADEFFLYQCITGDPTDGFTGAGRKGFGPVTLQKWIDKNGGYTWANVVKFWEESGKTYEDLLICARCARILTNDMYNEETHEITPWTPESAGFITTKA